MFTFSRFTWNRWRAQSAHTHTHAASVVVVPFCVRINDDGERVESTDNLHEAIVSVFTICQNALQAIEKTRHASCQTEVCERTECIYNWKMCDYDAYTMLYSITVRNDCGLQARRLCAPPTNHIVILCNIFQPSALLWSTVTLLLLRHIEWNEFRHCVCRHESNEAVALYVRIATPPTTVQTMLVNAKRNAVDNVVLANALPWTMTLSSSCNALHVYTGKSS